MKFLVDAQLPPALARALREKGSDVQSGRELGLREAEDDAIWDYALAHRRTHRQSPSDVDSLRMSRNENGAREKGTGTHASGFLRAA